MLSLLHALKSENIILELNYQFAKLIDRKQQPYGYTEQQQNLAVLLAALVSYNVMQGHSAIRLDSSLTENPFGLAGRGLERDFYAEILQKIGKIRPLAWQQTLGDHIAFSDSPSKVAPMLFQHGLLYFYRYWQAEHNVASYLQQAVIFQENFANIAQDKAILDRLFPPQNHEIDWQKIAVATALRKRFCVISGGPGTGKTTTVAKLLVALQEKQLHLGKPPLNIALVAPTGKAAARLKESITSSVATLNVTFDMPTHASTIHRLLGIRPQSDTPLYHAQNPLHLDLLVVDEASMIDLSLMEKLMNALKPSTRLVLLGDKDQLASVEAGALMGELGQFITQGYSRTHGDYLAQVTGYQLPSQGKVLPIGDSLCHLRKSYRFDEKSGIGNLAAAVNTQQAVKSWQLFANSAFQDVERITYPPVTQFAEKRLWIAHCANLVVQKAVECYRHYLTLVKQREKNPARVSVGEIFDAFQQVRFLAALRVSELGVERLNQRIADALQQAKLVQFQHSRDRYAGKPLLITRNSSQNQIYSGDIGLILPDEKGDLRAYFDTVMGEQYLSLSLSRVPESEPAYVMTVHKSQGSEFAHTLFIMPLTVAPVVTKELIYTAITRAKKKFTLFGAENVWKQGVSMEVERQSGLQEQLRKVLQQAS